jgi:thiamine kinase-like enzyme
VEQHATRGFPEHNIAVNDAVHRILARLPGIDPSRALLTPLGGGITNQNFRIDQGGESFVLRIGSEAGAILGIDRRHEHSAALAAAQLGIGAEVIHFIEEERVLLTRFIAGQVLTPEVAARPEMVARAAATMRAYHAGPAFAGRFSAFDTVRDYHRKAIALGVAFPDELPRVLALLGRLEAAVGASGRPVPCHNDLLAGNFIDDGERLRLIDWEYAGMGDPFFDLGNFAVNLGLDRAARRGLLAAYLGSARPADEARLELFRLASDLREAFWGFLQSGATRGGFDYRQYGLDHLRRFLDNAGGRELETWLDLVRRGSR